MVNLLVGIGGTPSSVQQLVPMVPYMGSNQYFMTYSFLNLLYCTLIFEGWMILGNASNAIWTFLVCDVMSSIGITVNKNHDGRHNPYVVV